MRNLKLGISALALTVASSAIAQTTNNPWVIGVGAHAENFMAAQNSYKNTLKLHNAENVLFKTNNFTTTPPLSKLTVARSLSKGIVLDWQTTVGNVDNKRFATDKEFFLQTGLGLQFKAAGLLWNEESWFDPYVRIGGNYLRYDQTSLAFPRKDYEGKTVANGDNGNESGKANHINLATGVGANFWLTKNFGLGVQGDYISTPGDKSSASDFFQAGASLLFKFGNRDRDKDGVLDKDDLCPDTPGLAKFNGCPDTDGDGVADKDDRCPSVAGPIENQGCPWPDSDNDGVLDKDDKCPTTAGPVENQGCPWPDTDKDGILDKDDACPTIPGLAEYNGCPKPKSVTATQTEAALKDILFNFNKATIRPESSSKLDAAATLIKTDGGTYLVTGHTDAKGNAAYNLRLSRERAAAVVAALEARGVNLDELKSRGVGSATAILPATASDADRMSDRKVTVTSVEGAEWDALAKKDYADAPVKAKKVTKKVAKKATKKVIKKK